MAFVLRRELRRRGARREGERHGHGLLHRHPLRHAHARLLLHPHLQLEDDQSHGLPHVRLLLPLRRRLARLRVQRLLVSTLDNKRQQVRSMAPIAATRNQTNIDVGELFV